MVALGMIWNVYFIEYLRDSGNSQYTQINRKGSYVPSALICRKHLPSGGFLELFTQVKSLLWLQVGGCFAAQTELVCLCLCVCSQPHRWLRCWEGVSRSTFRWKWSFQSL